MPSLEHVCIPFLYVLPTRKPSVRRHDYTVLSVESCHGGSIECVQRFDVFRAQRRKFGQRIDISKKIALLGDWWTGCILLVGKDWQAKADC